MIIVQFNPDGTRTVTTPKSMFTVDADWNPVRGYPKPVRCGRCRRDLVGVVLDVTGGTSIPIDFPLDAPWSQRYTPRVTLTHRPCGCQFNDMGEWSSSQ